MLLYIGEDIKKTKTGGDVINYRNIKALKTIFKENFKIIDISCTSKIKTFCSLILGFMNGLTINNSSMIIKKVLNAPNSSVFLSSSKMGKLAALIKKHSPETRIIVFFHNIEKQYTKEEFRVNPTFKNWLLYKVTSYNEKLASKYGDTFIVLNERDKKLLQEYYELKATITLPTSFEDKYDKDKKSNIRLNKNNSYLSLLFVGSAFFANIEALNWFIDNVLPFLPKCKLTIVGNGMHEIYQNSENINVHGYVDDLSSYYYQCDMVISPIFSGGGMKTKTAEALMYGCPIIGTKEAFEGYDLDVEKVGASCNDANCMINSILKYQENRYLLESCANYARNIYIQKYSFNTTIELLKKLKIK